jgi:site-specific recombinase XerD
MLRQFVLWLDVPIEETTNHTVLRYIDHLLERDLAPKTINCHLVSVRRFYDYLKDEEGDQLVNPVKQGCWLRLGRPLPKHLRDAEVMRLFEVITKRRDRAMFMLMLRCGLRVAEVSKVTLGSFDLRRRRLFVHQGKGRKDRVVYLSNDTLNSIIDYLKVRRRSKAKKFFLVEKGRHAGKPISVRGIQKRLEHYAQKADLCVSCHQLRHTMATQLLNADADLVTIQDILGHSSIMTTQWYCTVSNTKVQRDYNKAMEEVMQRTGTLEDL